MELYGIKINSLNIERAEQFQLSVKINQISSEKLSLKNLKIYKECMASFTFLPPSNFTVLNGCYFFWYYLQRAENYINCSNQLTPSTFDLICGQGDAFCGLTGMLMSKNINNDVTKESFITQLS